MIRPMPPTDNSAPRHRPAWVEQAGFALFVLTLAWAPFPLGSNRAWSWSLLCILIAVCWAIWVGEVWSDPYGIRRTARGLTWPFALGALALFWGVIQILPGVPETWTHPVWQLAGSVLGTHPGGTISLDPWRTATEVMKLASYAMALWLVRVFASRSERANRLLDILILITALYAAYALVMTSLGVVQFNIFYSQIASSHDISGPFVNRNSYATYAGLGALCAGVRLVERGSATIVVHRGLRTLCPHACAIFAWTWRALFDRGRTYGLHPHRHRFARGQFRLLGGRGKYFSAYACAEYPPGPGVVGDECCDCLPDGICCPLLDQWRYVDFALR